MPRRTAKNTMALCKNFCAYYKPGRNEELECQGSIVVRRLVEKGKKLSQERTRAALALDAGTLGGLRGRVCSACSFREADCDYAASGGAAEPCGGFALLSHLLGTGDLKLEEIE